MRQPIYLGGGPLEPVGADRWPGTCPTPGEGERRSDREPITLWCPPALSECTVALGAYISALVLPLQQRSYSIASGYTLEVKTHEFPSEDQRSWTVQLPRS